MAEKEIEISQQIAVNRNKDVKDKSEVITDGIYTLLNLINIFYVTKITDFRITSLKLHSLRLFLSVVR